MGVREAHSRRGKPVKMGRGDFALGIEAPYVAIAQIVRQNVDNIGPLRERTRPPPSSAAMGTNTTARTAPHQRPSDLLRIFGLLAHAGRTREIGRNGWATGIQAT